MNNPVLIVVLAIFSLLENYQNEWHGAGNDLMPDTVNEGKANTNPSLFNSFANCKFIANSIV